MLTLLSGFRAIALTVTVASPLCARCARVTHQSVAEVMHDMRRRLNAKLNLKKESTSWVEILMTKSY